MIQVAPILPDALPETSSHLAKDVTATPLMVDGSDTFIEKLAATARDVPPPGPITTRFPRPWRRWLARWRLYRRSLRSLGLDRLLSGGWISDGGRVPRYGLLAVVAFGAIWAPITVYLLIAPKKFKSEVTLILPGAGVSNSVTLSEIGQSSSSENSAYASSSLSPSVTYKNLLESDIVINGAAKIIGVAPHAFGKPVVKLVDETSLIHFATTDGTPDRARRKSQALLASLTAVLDHLRSDEIRQKEFAAAKVIKNYQATFDAIRLRINALELQSGLTSAEQYSAIVMATETLETQVADIDAQMVEKDASVQSLAGLLKVSPQIAALTLKIQADEETGALVEAVAKAAANAGELEKQYGPGHPKFLDAQAKEMGLRARMVARAMAISGLTPQRLDADVDAASKGERPALLARLVASVVDRQGLAAQLKSLRAELAARRERIHDLVDVGSKLDSLNRDYKVADAVFASALARANTSRGDVYASYPMTQVVAPASLPKSPSSPNVLIATGAGLAASLFLFVGLAMSWLRRPLIEWILAKVTNGRRAPET